jgi:hypothetical protein
MGGWFRGLQTSGPKDEFGRGGMSELRDRNPIPLAVQTQKCHHAFSGVNAMLESD